MQDTFLSTLRGYCTVNPIVGCRLCQFSDKGTIYISPVWRIASSALPVRTSSCNRRLRSCIFMVPGERISYCFDPQEHCALLVHVSLFSIFKPSGQLTSLNGGGVQSRRKELLRGRCSDPSRDTDQGVLICSRSTCIYARPPYDLHTQGRMRVPCPRLRGVQDRQASLGGLSGFAVSLFTSPACGRR